MIFGKESQTGELLQMIRKQYMHLKWSPGVDVKMKGHKFNPKRLQRVMRYQMETQGIGTKSQQAYKCFVNK